jgi:hypothetical protein
MVRVLKESLKRVKQGDVDTRLSRLLFRYRITPHTLTGQSPSELLLGRRVRSALSLLKPSLQDTVKRKQENGAQRGRMRAFEIGDSVLVTNFRGEGRWLPGVVVEIKGATNYEVQLDDGRIMHRHLDQMVEYRRQDVPEAMVQDVLPQGQVEESQSPEIPTSSVERGQLETGTERDVPLHRQPPDVPAACVTPEAVPVVTSPGRAAVTRPSAAGIAETGAALASRTSAGAASGSEMAMPGRARSTRVSRPPAYLADYVP